MRVAHVTDTEVTLIVAENLTLEQADRRYAEAIEAIGPNPWDHVDQLMDAHEAYRRDMCLIDGITPDFHTIPGARRKVRWENLATKFGITLDEAGSREAILNRIRSEAHYDTISNVEDEEAAS